MFGTGLTHSGGKTGPACELELEEPLDDERTSSDARKSLGAGTSRTSCTSREPRVSDPPDEGPGSEDEPLEVDAAEMRPSSTFRRRASDPFLQKNAAERTYDAHSKVIFGVTLVSSAVAGTKLNEHVGRTVTPLELQPSTAAGAGLLALSFVTKKLGYTRTSQTALAAGLGQGLATVSAHVPKEALMSGGGGSPKV